MARPAPVREDATTSLNDNEPQDDKPPPLSQSAAVGAVEGSTVRDGKISRKASTSALDKLWFPSVTDKLVALPPVQAQQTLGECSQLNGGDARVRVEVKALPVANRGLTVDYTHPFRASLLGPAEQNQTDPISCCFVEWLLHLLESLNNLGAHLTDCPVADIYHGTPRTQWSSTPLLGGLSDLRGQALKRSDPVGMGSQGLKVAT